jgi:hypothetical protein
MFWFNSGDINMSLNDQIIILLLFQVKLTPKKSKSRERGKKVHQETRHKELKNVKFSASKLERMKRLAQLLSKQIASINTQGELVFLYCISSLFFLSYMAYSCM